MPAQFKNPLPGVPHIESPFFSKLFQADTHSPEVLRIASDLNTKGYAVLDFPDADGPSIAITAPLRVIAASGWIRAPARSAGS